MLVWGAGGSGEGPGAAHQPLDGQGTPRRHDALSGTTLCLLTRVRCLRVFLSI